MLVGGVIAGKILDREYRLIEQKLLRKAKEKSGDPESITPSDIDDDFPIEVARFRTMPIYLILFIVTCAGYGWTLQQGVNLACPLVLLIISMLPYYPLLLVKCSNSSQSGLCHCLHSQHNADSNCRPRTYTRFLHHSLRTCTVHILYSTTSPSSQNNLVRCSLGAALVSIIDIIIKSVGMGWAYVILAAMCLVVSPPFLSIMHFGPKLRARRRAQL